MIFDKIKIKGAIKTDRATLKKYSHDASLLTVVPSAVIFPQDVEDIKSVVSFISKNKDKHPDLSITARSAGTCMSGGSINESIIIDFTKFINHPPVVKQAIPKEWELKTNLNLRNSEIAGYAITSPGTYYRDLEAETLKQDLLMPTYTASKELCALGGMYGNNSGGELSIKYGKCNQSVISSKVILSDGNEYEIKPLSESELKEKIKQNDFEGSVYKKLFQLIEDNYEKLQAAKPKVSKNSAGYNLWDVWDRKSRTFDLNQLLVGSQGTLALTTEITWRLIKKSPREKMLVIFLNELDSLGDITNTILKHKPDSVETYDDASMKLAVKFFRDFFRTMGFWGAIKLGFRFIPETLMVLRGGLPKLVVVVQFDGHNEDLLTKKVKNLKNDLKEFKINMRIPKSDADERKYWRIRHESFNLLRKHVRGMRTAPFIDDFIVKPSNLPEFLPRLNKILAEYPELVYTIAGHLGDGNFHIIPLMDMEKPGNVEIIDKLSEKVYDLVVAYGGSITAEHNDGIIRTPYLSKMYTSDIIKLFNDVKNIFDPQNIFNPGKKVGGTKEYMLQHVSKDNKHN